MDENAKTIRPNRSPPSGKSLLSSTTSARMASIVEDYSDLAAEEDDAFQFKIADFKV